MLRTPLSLILQTATLLILALPAWGAVQLSASTEQAQLGVPFELQIEVSQYSSVIGAPELGPLEQDFKINSNRSVYLTEKQAGRTLFISRWILSLSPKHTGRLTIPALKVKGEWSQTLSIQVEPKPKPKAEPLILRVLLDSGDLYQGSPINLSVKLYYKLALQSAELTQPRLEGVNIEQYGDQLSYPELLDQQRYQVIEQKYLLQALKPKRYRIPSLLFKGTDASGRSISSQSEPIDFDILPRPGNLSTSIQLTASEVRLEQDWQQPLENLRAGDALSRSITLIAHGIPASWLPDISLPRVEGISVYPQPAQLEQSSASGVLVSRKRFDFKLLLTQPGNQHLPEITLVWWDSVRDKVEVARLPPSDIRVLPFETEITEPVATKKPAPPVTPISNNAEATPLSSSTTPWQAWAWAGIALICAIGWTLSQQRSKRLESELTALKQLPTPAEPIAPPLIDPALQHNSFSELSEACERNDPELACHYLFEWAAAHWPGMRVRTLEDIEDLAKDPTLTYLLKNLQHQLQDPRDSWHGDLLMERIRRLRQKNNRPQANRGTLRVAIDD